VHKKVANENKQVLSPPEEKTLVDWIGYQAAIANPLDREEICSLVLDITGIFPGLNWIYRFEQRHPEICTSQPRNLDPKCNEGRRIGLGNGPNALSARAMSPGMDTLPFVDISI